MFRFVASRFCRVAPPARDNLQAIYREISQYRTKKHGLSERELKSIFSVVLNSNSINEFNEKFLSLTISLLLNPVNHKPEIGCSSEKDIAIESLIKRVMASGLTLQGCNQILGAFAKLKTTTNCSIEPYAHAINQVYSYFLSHDGMLTNCPNRELSNIFWAASVLKLPNKIISPEKLKSMDCTDISLICAGLMDSPDDELWPHIRSDLLSRKSFTPKDIPSIMCSLACVGINDRELVLHLASNVVRNNLLNSRNVAAIVWAVATSDFIYQPLLNKSIQFLDQVSDPMDVRRISRGFAVCGKLQMIEDWLMTKLILNSPRKHHASDITDSVIIWELVTNKLFNEALKVFRTKTLADWRREVTESTTNASQLYHMYLGSLADETLELSPEERNFLLSLQEAFSLSTDDMSSSILHRQASDSLRDLGLEHISEYKEPVTGFVIDSFIPSTNTGLEVQGPTHFITDLETGASILRPADVLKHEVLRKVSSMRIVQATPWNFGPKLKKPNKLLMKAILSEGKLGNRKL